MTTTKKVVLITAGIAVLGAAIIFFIDQGNKKKYNVLKDRSFEILVQKDT